MSATLPTARTHQPVMPGAVLAALEPRSGATLVDGTLGLAGHAAQLLERIGRDGLLIGMDRDRDLLTRATARLDSYGAAFRPVNAPFSLLREAVLGSGEPWVDGILLDLGLCSAQLDDPERGFSFRDVARESALDMRMDRDRGQTAAELLEQSSEAQLAAILADGDVPRPRRTARALLERRPLRQVGDLLDALESLAGARRTHHPATLVFQALRMAVNDEAQELSCALEASAELLAPGGRLVVLTYHSGEDRLVKQFLAREERGCICPPQVPECACGRAPRFRTLVAGSGPDPREVGDNPRARSARLRAGERL